MKSATLDPRLPLGRVIRARTWMSAPLVAVIFLAGLICGAAAMRMAPQTKPQVSSKDLLERVAKRMQRELDLTEAQRASIEQVVRAHQPKLNRIRARTLHEMRVELQQVIEDMSVLLTPEQASRFRSEVQPRLDAHFPADDEKPPANPNSN